MASLIISSGRTFTHSEVQLITFTQDDAIGIHYPHCGSLVLRIVVDRNGLKRMLVHNVSSVDII